MTVQDVVTAAFGHSQRNIPAQIADQPSELVKLVGRKLRLMFAVAARINPLYYAKTSDEALSGGGWPFPTDAELIFRLEQGGSEVIVVPVWDTQADTARPAVYQIGKKLFSAGQPNDPTSGTLRYVYSRQPSIPAQLVDTIDPDFPDFGEDLLATEVALYLSVKDARGSRQTEIGPLRAQRDENLALYLAHIEHVLPIELRRYAKLRLFNPPGFVSLRGQFAGGTNVEVAA